MSREERRNYQRQMRSIDRTPSLPPAARARADRNAAKRAEGRGGPATYAYTRRFLLLAVIIALAAGYGAFSILWPNLPFAIFVGIGVAVLAFAIVLGFRRVQRMAAGQ